MESALPVPPAYAISTSPRDPARGGLLKTVQHVGRRTGGTETSGARHIRQDDSPAAFEKVHSWHSISELAVVRADSTRALALEPIGPVPLAEGGAGRVPSTEGSELAACEMAMSSGFERLLTPQPIE